MTLSVQSVDSYRRAEVTVQNHTRRHLDLDFSRTSFTPSGNSDAQRLGLSHVAGSEPGAYVLSLDPGIRGTIEFEARCLDYHRPAPSNGLQYVAVSVPLPPLISEMLKRGVRQEDIWLDIEENPQLKAEWIRQDPRGTSIKPSSTAISTTIPLAELRTSSGGQSTDITGTWNSTIGWVYDITGGGNTYQWVVRNVGQIGHMQLTQQYTFYCQWGQPGANAANHHITKWDSSGRPIEITGDNGVVFFRAPSEAQSRAQMGSGGRSTNISGTWNSTIGWVYDITGGGNTYQWVVRGVGQIGHMQLTQQYTFYCQWGEPGPSYTYNHITKWDSSGRPIEITGDNGVVFFRN